MPTEKKPTEKSGAEKSGAGSGTRYVCLADVMFAEPGMSASTVRRRTGETIWSSEIDPDSLRRLLDAQGLEKR